MGCCRQDVVNSKDLLKDLFTEKCKTTYDFGWELKDKIQHCGSIVEKKDFFIKRTYLFDTYRECVAFVVCVTEYAEDIEHHPDIELRWGEVIITLWTHHAGGLTRFDFDAANGIELIYKKIAIPGTLPEN